MIAVATDHPPPTEPGEQDLRCPNCGKLFATGHAQALRLVVKCPRCKHWTIYTAHQTSLPLHGGGPGRG